MSPTTCSLPVKVTAVQFGECRVEEEAQQGGPLRSPSLKPRERAGGSGAVETHAGPCRRMSQMSHMSHMTHCYGAESPRGRRGSGPGWEMLMEATIWEMTQEGAGLLIRRGRPRTYPRDP